MPTTQGVPFGPFRLEETLGRGGMGEVWRAYDTRNGTRVALKRLVLPAADPAARARFRRESEVLNALRHPHMVGILDYGEVDGQPHSRRGWSRGPIWSGGWGGVYWSLRTRCGS